MNEIQKLLRAGDFFAAVEQLQRSGTPTEIAGRYRSQVSDLYWKQHDLPAVVAIGRAGILYCLGQSLLDGTSPESIDRLRSTAKGLAYDVGSFTWPGWEEPGINPTPEDLAAGRECARLNLRLAIELKKPADRVSMAHWLVGAHALANSDADLAAAEFQLSIEALIDVSETSPVKLYNRGCLAVAGMCGGDGAAEAAFADITSKLASLADDDSKSYLTQLQSAHRLFVDQR